MEKETGGIQVIARAAAILRALGREGVSLGTLARQTGLPRSTVQRIVDALATEHFVEAGDAGVRLGWGIGRLAQIAHSDVVVRVRPYLESLFHLSNETVDIAFRRGKEVAFLDRIISEQELRVVPITNKPRPLYAMANGKALLSTMTDKEVGMLLGESFERLTPATAGDLPSLLATLAVVRNGGFAYDREEHAVGVCAIGMPICVQGLQPHAISIAVPAQRFDAQLPALRAALRDARTGIEAALNGMLSESVAP